MSKIIFKAGEATIYTEGKDTGAAMPEILIGSVDGPVGAAFANMMAQSKGHTAMFAVRDLNQLVRPACMMAPKVTLKDSANIEPGSPWENGFCESFNGTFRDNLLDGEIFYSLQEAKVVVGEWVKHDNHERPHSALGYRPPAPQGQIPKIIQTQPILLQ
jgi:formaldehyde-activating enzyme